MNIQKSLILLIMCLALPLVGQAQSAHWALTPTYQSVTPFAPNLFKVKTYASVGICDADEKWVVSLAMDSITNITNGFALALTKVKDKYRIAYIIRENGTREAVKEELYAGDHPYFSEDRCPVMNKKGKYGYLSPSGDLVIACDYSSVQPFLNGRALATKEKGGFAGLFGKKKGKVFEIDMKGNAREASQVNPEALSSTSTGKMSEAYSPNPDPAYQRFSENNAYGYRKGSTIILPAQFESASSVSNDCAIVMVNHLFGVVRFNSSDVSCKVSESGGHLKAEATLPAVWEKKIATITRIVNGASRKEFEMEGTGMERSLDVTVDKESGKKVYELVCDKLVLWKSKDSDSPGPTPPGPKGIFVSAPSTIKAKNNVCTIKVKVTNKTSSACGIKLSLTTGQGKSVNVGAGRSTSVSFNVTVSRDTKCTIVASGGGYSDSCTTNLKVK